MSSNVGATTRQPAMSSKLESRVDMRRSLALADLICLIRDDT